LAGLRGLLLDVPCRVSPFFNAVRRLRAEVLHVRLCALASVGRCIPRVSRLQGRVRWVWARRFRLRERHVREVVRVGRRDGLGNGMFRAA
jgi:hypothetical protein